MSLAQYLLLVLLSLPNAHRDTESWTEREQRMGTIAMAIDAASSRATCTKPYDTEVCKPIWPGKKKELALVLLTKAWWESRVAQNVHEGRCFDHECDAYRKNGYIVHKARTIWQIQKTGYVSDKEWNTMVGTDFESTRTAAWVATRILSHGKTRCGSTYGTFSYYGRGRCSWEGAHKRVRFYNKLLPKTSEQLAKAVEQRKSVAE